MGDPVKSIDHITLRSEPDYDPWASQYRPGTIQWDGRDLERANLRSDWNERIPAAFNDDGRRDLRRNLQSGQQVSGLYVSGDQAGSFQVSNMIRDTLFYCQNGLFDSANEVRRIEARLYLLGYSNEASPDGVFSLEQQRALARFAQDHTRGGFFTDQSVAIELPANPTPAQVLSAQFQAVQYGLVRENSRGIMTIGGADDLPEFRLDGIDGPMTRQAISGQTVEQIRSARHDAEIAASQQRQREENLASIPRILEQIPENQRAWDQAVLARHPELASIWLGQAHSFYGWDINRNAFSARSIILGTPGAVSPEKGEVGEIGEIGKMLADHPELVEIEWRLLQVPVNPPERERRFLLDSFVGNSTRDEVRARMYRAAGIDIGNQTSLSVEDAASLLPTGRIGETALNRMKAAHDEWWRTESPTSSETNVVGLGALGVALLPAAFAAIPAAGSGASASATTTGGSFALRSAFANAPQILANAPGQLAGAWSRAGWFTKGTSSIFGGSFIIDPVGAPVSAIAQSVGMPADIYYIVRDGAPPDSSDFLSSDQLKSVIYEITGITRRTDMAAETAQTVASFAGPMAIGKVYQGITGLTQFQNAPKALRYVFHGAFLDDALSASRPIMYSAIALGAPALRMAWETFFGADPRPDEQGVNPDPVRQPPSGPVSP